MAAILLMGCGHKSLTATLLLRNDSDMPLTGVLAEVDYKELKDMVGSDRIQLTDEQGHHIPTQITHDSLLVFPVSISPHGVAKYHVGKTLEAETADTLCCGAVYPDNRDDLCWENEYVGFRAYGGGTMAVGEKMYGYDLFLKRGTERPVIASMIAKDKDPASWREFDRLKALGKDEAADSLVRTFSYHVDHGYGMDCYAVGATLGACTPALIMDDTIIFPWCHTKASVLDNGPLRFSAQIEFDPIVIDNDTVREIRTITLDKGTNFNSSRVRYEGLKTSHDVAVGIALHDGGASVLIDKGNRFISYLDPTQGNDNGELYLGAVFPQLCDTTMVAQGHVIAGKRLAPGERLHYYWGFGWNRNNVPSYDEWLRMLEALYEKVNNPLKIEIIK